MKIFIYNKGSKQEIKLKGTIQRTFIFIFLPIWIGPGPNVRRFWYLNKIKKTMFRLVTEFWRQLGITYGISEIYIFLINVCKSRRLF
jgi:hypothetical protein